MTTRGCVQGRWILPELSRRICVMVFLGFSAMISVSTVVASFELSPEMLADKKLIEAEMLHDKQDYVDALKVMDEIIALQKEHKFKFADEFHYKYARIALSAGSARIAIDSIGRYLEATGREGEFYKVALALLIEVEETQISVEETCAGKPEGSLCWKELANHSGCFVWDDYFYEHQTVTWSGGRYGSVAHGQGTLIWTSGRGNSSYTGRLEKGKQVGHCVVRRDNGAKEKGEYVAGKREGRWLLFRPGEAPGERCNSVIFRSGDQVTDWKNVNESMCDF